MAKKEHYVNNKKFQELMKVFIAKRKRNKKHPLPEAIGTKIKKLVEGYSYKPNFINYTFKDRMISDAIYTCVRYADRFDPIKYNNPFAYFTRIAWSSFVKVIIDEKKTTKLKKKLIEIETTNNKFVRPNDKYDINKLVGLDGKIEFNPITIRKNGVKIKIDTIEEWTIYSEKLVKEKNIIKPKIKTRSKSTKPKTKPKKIYMLF